LYSVCCQSNHTFGVANFIRTQKLRPILKINRLELWQESSRRNDEQVNTNISRIDGEQKRQFSREFKSEAVRLSYQRDNIKDLADELGI
jgi:hypothetical protein